MGTVYFDCYLSCAHMKIPSRHMKMVKWWIFAREDHSFWGKNTIAKARGDLYLLHLRDLYEVHEVSKLHIH